MKNFRIIVFVLMVFSMMTSVQAQDYQQLWDKVEQVKKKDLPQSVIREAKGIYDKAKAERNVPQTMKSYLTLLAFREEIAPDSMEVDVKGLEAWASESQTSVAERAVLHSILGDIFIRKDFDKGNAYLKLSLEDSLALVRYPAEKLEPVVRTGETSRMYLDNSLYDLLARRAIGLWNAYSWGVNREEVLKTIERTWQALLDGYQRQGKKDAWLLTALQAYPEADEAKLRSWIKEFGELDVCAEAYLRLAQRMLGEDKPEERLALVREAILRYPKYKRISALKNIEKEILSPQLQLTIASAYPDRAVDVTVGHRNLKGLEVQIYRLHLSADSKELEKVDEKTVSLYGSFYRKEGRALQPSADYRMTNTLVTLSPLPEGVYFLMASGKGYGGIKKGTVVVVDDTMEIYRPLPDRKRKTVMLDKVSGMPAETVVSSNEGWPRYNYSEPRQKQTLECIFTDRAIYRPGQTVFFSGLVYEQQDDLVEVAEGRDYQVSLLDTDRKELAKVEVRTDEFGGFSGSFALPEDGQTGIYSIKAGKQIQSVRVEAYKRPTFDVEFEEVKTAYRAGDSIVVSGVACTFAGAPVQYATVKYTIERMEGNGWRYRGAVTNRVEGKSETDGDGRFSIPVHFLLIESDRHYWFHTYRVTAEVTGLSGETQSGSLSLPLGSSSLQVYVDGWKKDYVKEQPHALTCVVENWSGQPVGKEVLCEVLKEGQVVSSFKVRSNESFVPEQLVQLPSGQYIFRVEVNDENGNENRQEVPLTLFGMKDEHIPCSETVWSYQTADTFPSTILYGSDEEDVTLFYDVFSGNRLIESKRIHFSDSLLRFPFEYKEEYGDGVLVTFAFVKNRRLYSKNFSIRKPIPDKSLQLKWKTFRDKLQPGMQETWTLTVRRQDGSPVDAQLLAAMYDASLDAFVKQTWNLSVSFQRVVPYSSWRSEGGNDVWLNVYYPIKNLKTTPLDYSTLDLPFNRQMRGAAVRMYSARPNEELKYVATDSANEWVVELEEAVEVQGDADAGMEGNGNNQFRSDLAETAFFYPALRTDETGEVSFSFTLPESLTTWRFMGLAHTREMDWGQITSEAVASKDFMLQPNMPRFVRTGDEVSLSALLVNLTDQDVLGTVRMELFNPASETVYMVKKQRFLVTPRASSTVSFGFEVLEEYQEMAVRWVAEGENFSDGEQHLLPVLSNKQRITESVPLYINGKGTATFSLESLFNHHSQSVSYPEMTVEFVGNPGWYAVQALSALQYPDNEDAVSWAVSLYAHMLATQLAETNAGVASCLGTDSLQLIVPKAIRALQGLQDESGAWSWYKGMDGSRYITIQVVELMARLQKLSGKPLQEEGLQSMYIKALDYLAREAKKEYAEHQKREKEGVKNPMPSEWVLHYLYIYALDAKAGSDKAMNDYWIDRLAELDGAGALTIYGKAVAAVVLQAAGKDEKAQEMLQSLMEYSVYTDEMGRYFDTSRAEYSWKSYKIPTQVAAIEAMACIANDAQAQEELKRWLLQQKRVQDWESPIATTDAVYALLSNGENALSNTGECQIVLGKQRMRVGKGEPIAYLKQNVEGNVMEIREVTVKKKSAGTGWGAVYAEYVEDMDKIGSQGKALSVRKEMYRNGKLLAESDVLKVGDKLTIRLEVKTDRDMDFVEVKDERAACVEPVDVLSGYRWKDGLGYHQRTKDASTSFFVERMRKGTYVLQYDVYVNVTGVYQEGAATIRSVYAPEFGGHTGGAILRVE